MNTIYGGTGKSVIPISNNKMVEIIAEADGIRISLGLLLNPERALANIESVKESI